MDLAERNLYRYLLKWGHIPSLHNADRRQYSLGLQIPDHVFHCHRVNRNITCQSAINLY